MSNCVINWKCIGILVVILIVANLLYMGFVKFYRRFTLENYMALLTEKPWEANNRIFVANVMHRWHNAVPSRTIWRDLWWSANLIAQRFRAPEGGYIPNPYGRDLGLGYRVRTLPLGRDRWGIYSTVVRLHPLVPEVSPRRGTEGVAKTIEERLGEKGGALLAGETER